MNELNVKVLYEDNHIICAIKPRGILSQADGTNAPDMLSILKGYIKVKYKKQGDAFLGLVHRLDRPVGGVMVFARTSKAAGRLSEQIRTRAVNKENLAVLEGAPEQSSGTLENRISKDRHLNLASVARVDDAQTHTKEYAALKYQVLAITEPVAEGLALVRVGLLTGRSHQIRAQFAYINHPVIGDRKYGARNNTWRNTHYDGRQSARNGECQNAHANMNFPALWAASLAFSHPIQNTPLVISAPPPYEFEYPWDKFDPKYYKHE